MSTSSSGEMTSRAAYDFAGRVAVVTGGAQGIGAAIAETFRAAGATTVVWDRTPTPDGVAVDVTDAAAVAQAADETLSRCGRIDVLVNNAGYAGVTVPLVDYPLEEWRRILDVNLHGAFHACRAVVPGIVEAGYGRIVAIGSLAGKEGTPNASAYSAAKAGVLALVKSLGKELAGSGVLVNAIAPAAVRTPLLDQMSPAHVETMIGKSPLKRLGEPEEVAALALWLASDSCSFNTGAVFDLSGGRATY
ncbi:SDR family NAD(P)-dependent oxidoreductase [Methylopila sp. 73B]|uniref:SDR family NAD(P)-dependent oxidoreductase n=1 Tax=Methylopila sp. 73B TaxID=1120792 RepID=UPI001FD88DD1|nr:SDR family NAD(P)-dependent oxidoreductase [Methylopila sp. 73B]